MNKKGISTTLMGILFLFIGVFGTIFILGWLDDFSEDLSNTYFPEGSVSVDALAGDYLYVRNSNRENFTYDGVRINGVECAASGQIGSNRITQINVSDCVGSGTTTPKEIVLLGDSWLYSEEKIHRGAVIVISEGSGSSTASLSGFAYGEKTGYVSFNGSNYGVNISSGVFNGFAYSEKVGYISFNGSNYGVNLSGSNLVGHAYGEYIGFIQFNNSPTYQATYNGSHILGNAYGEYIGYIDFNNAPSYEISGS